MTLSHSSLVKKAAAIRLLAMDVDGVLTGGEVIVLESGEEIKFWNAKDRLGLAMCQTLVPELSFAWITGRKSRAVSRAAKDLGVRFVVQNCSDKLGAIESISKKLKIALSQVAFIGDDLIDLSAIRKVGFSACPHDAVGDIRESVHYVSKMPGGRGVARDVLEFILKAQKKWKRLIISSYL